MFNAGDIKSQEDLKRLIEIASEDLKRRANDISIDWNKRIRSIEFRLEMRPDRPLEWEVNKIYLIEENVEKYENNN